MRLGTARLGDSTGVVRLDPGATSAESIATVLPYRTVGSLLRETPDWAHRVPEMSGEALDPALIDFAPLVMGEERVFCIGLNYRRHIEEMGREIPTHPSVFTKTTASLIGARDRISLPEIAEQVDWEAELTVVVGRRVRDADVEEAVDAIAGYTVMNDVSVRDWQRRTSQWWQGKNFEGSTPLGPYLVTKDEAGDPARLVVSCAVNGEQVQGASCGDLVFGPGELVAYLSRITTLLPGDVIATGTPGGVAAGMPEPRWLAEGDVLTTEVVGVGRCENRFSRSLPRPIDM